MSNLEYRQSVKDLLILILLIGILIIIGSLCVLSLGTWLNPSWMSQDLILIFPFLTVGFIIVCISAKLLELLN